MSENKKPCPQFPYWGAHYPDACCIDGKLYDLDRCDEILEANRDVLERIKEKGD